MIELIIRLVVLFGLAFGIGYGITRAARSRRQKRILAELAEAREKLASLRQALADGQLSQPEHDDLAVRIYERCRDRGVPLEDEVEVAVPSGGAEREK
jgi:F0F1-type ATP synthase membrane subunit b/b'